MLEDEPDIDVIVVPIGGGSGAAGACIVAKAIRPGIEVIGVQSEAAPAAYRSWQAGAAGRGRDGDVRRGARDARRRSSCRSGSCGEQLDDFVLVSDDEIRAAIGAMIETTRNLVEAAGAAPLAGALSLRERLAGRRVALVCSGGNISPAQLAEVLGA